MDKCSFCGEELTGAKRFCVRCGREQHDYAEKAAAKREAVKKPVKVPDAEYECHRCGEPTDRTCYFCDSPICLQHIRKMQANALPALEFKTALHMGDHRRINRGWRGFIVSSCGRCMSMNDGRPLSEDEHRDIQTLDRCTWFQLSPKISKY